MTPSVECYALIKQWEKFRPTAYRPTHKDRWTCGYGHTQGVTPDTACTQNTAQEWLMEDVRWAADCVSHHVTVPLTQPQFDALVSLCFNIGAGNFTESTLLRELNDGQYGLAADQFLVWDKQKHVELAGLETRRKAERALFLSGVVAASAASGAG